MNIVIIVTCSVASVILSLLINVFICTCIPTVKRVVLIFVNTLIQISINIMIIIQ